ncbi:hypothetical protein CC80DRAFT_174714 [Byssothecium circinans]|uniref:F-box domain-containing protein n=1 Tax=Byssothecium circinans TaxID=147558 RepID=A0A6A5TKM1_9PLEO|nr:hypothetical protein CC80DRAFT_174714 [Byssothecium circinans]
MGSPSIFERFPEELRHLALSYCDSSTIHHLCLTSKAVYNVCINSLFHTIDLSTHNSGEWRRHKTYSNFHVPPDYGKALHTLQDMRLVERQANLMLLLERHLENLDNPKPSIALKTRCLRWTCTEPEESPREIRNYGLGQPWDTFSCFTKLIEIDIGFMAGTKEIVTPPSHLFSTTTSISLSGVTSHRVVSSILTSISAANLKHLRLNNLQLFADEPHILQNLAPTQIALYRRDRPGPIQGYLHDLTGHCTSLRSFHYLSTAEYFDGSYTSNPHTRARWTLQVTDENSRYAELASFIDSVKPTLREFYFEHGPDIDYFGTAFSQRFHGSFTRQTLTVPLPMDRFFDTHVLPILTAGPWPKLQTMTVKGIGHWKPVDAWSADATPAEVAWLHAKTRAFREKVLGIWEAVGEGCAVLVGDEAGRPFYRLWDDRGVNGRGTDGYDRV